MRQPPGTIIAVVVLLGIGGLQLGFQALGRGLPGLVYLPIGLLYIGLGWAIWRGKRWARITLLALAVLGAVLGVLRAMLGDPLTGLFGVLYSVVYAVLVSTERSRAWFATRGGAEPSSDRPL